MASRRTAIRRGVGLAFLALGLAAASAWAGEGKFYAVGMGTAPDLITLRALDVIKKADIFLLYGEGGKEEWKDRIGNREVWICWRSCTRYMGIDPETLKDPAEKETALKNTKARQEIVEKVRRAVAEGKIVAALEGGDVMVYGMTFILEMLPKDCPAEVVPGIGAFQAATAALKRSPVYGWDTNAAVLTMHDWPGRLDTNDKFMATQTSLVFYTMGMDYPRLFEQLKRYYPPETPVAVVNFAGDRERQQVIRSTVGTFLADVDRRKIPANRHMLFVGKFLTVGQARRDGLASAHRVMEGKTGCCPTPPQGKAPEK